MMIFVRKNKIISACFVGFLTICIIYIMSLDKEELFPHAGDWFGLLFQFSVGFIINFFFYVIQIYIPQYNQHKEINKCISSRITEIVGHMREIFSQLCGKYMIQYDESYITDEDLLNLLRKIKVDDRVAVLDARRSYSTCFNDEMCFTVKEWMLSRIEFVENEIDKLMNHYAPYISVELMKVLEGIQKSVMHNNVARVLLQLPREISLEGCNDDFFLKDYFALMKELETVKMQYER